MVKIREAIVVEGRYDKNTLSQVVDAPIFETNGFGIRKDKARMDLLRRVAEQRGLIVFTDSDGAGFVIRNFLKGAIPAKYLKHAYIPDIPGKERRKSAPGNFACLPETGGSHDSGRGHTHGTAHHQAGFVRLGPVRRGQCLGKTKETDEKAGAAGASQPKWPAAGPEPAVYPGGIDGTGGTVGDGT